MTSPATAVVAAAGARRVMFDSQAAFAGGVRADSPEAFHAVLRSA